MQDLCSGGHLGNGRCSAAWAGANHADFITGPFKSGPEVTAKCLECHQKQAGDFMKTPHWTWSEEQVVNGQKRMIGKKNVINNFCIAVPSNEPRCTVCHAGYGYKNDQLRLHQGGERGLPRLPRYDGRL